MKSEACSEVSPATNTEKSAAPSPLMSPSTLRLSASATVCNSPRTPENSRRIHSVDAVLAIWAMAMVWLALARTLGRPELIYPFTLVFACHMAIFGLSRAAHRDRLRSLAQLSAAITRGPTVAVAKAMTTPKAD